MSDFLDYGTGKGFGFFNQEWSSKEGVEAENAFVHRLAKLVRTALK